jgi:hypothetical protein
MRAIVRTMVQRKPTRSTPRAGWSLEVHAARRWVAALLILHAALVVWGVARNSVTFDENFHLPAGLMILQRQNFTASVAQPPLPKVLYALPALALGARLPSETAMASGDEGTVGESFMRVNAARYVRLYVAGRLVGLVFSLLLGLLVWRWARALYGEAAGVLSLALYALAPESLAHAGIIGTDLPTALSVTAVLYAFWRFANDSRWRTWVWAALAVAAASLVRFSAVQLVPVLALALVVAQAAGHLREPRRAWLGLLALIPLGWIVVNAGYLFGTCWGPWSDLPFRSERFRSFVRHWPAFRLPLPTAYIAGLDYMSLLGQHDQAVTFLLGKKLIGTVWYYFPLALLFKYPLGLLGAVGLRALIRVRGACAGRMPAEWLFGIAAAVTLGIAMFFTRYNFGVRYLLLLLPLACVWCGGLLAKGVPRFVRITAVVLAVVLLVESAAAAPWYLSFFNWPAGGPGGGYRLVNDSNVDWGQGLIALRDELKQRGIGRIHLAYHGTADPALYGIDYVPYLGGAPGKESDWLAVSSYYFVGLGQRMMTSRGRTEPLSLDFRPLWDVQPVARPADCIYLFPLRGAGGAR